jgi:hypothetical protein
MPPFERKYTAERTKAIYRARFEHGCTHNEIARRAQAGELVPGDPFKVPVGYVGKLCRAEEQRRALRFRSPLADKPHRDAIEELRRGLIAAADDMLSDYRALAKRKPANADPARGREIARLIREAAAIPTPKTDTPQAPGQRRDGQREGGETRGGTAGSLLTAHRGVSRHEHEDLSDHTHEAEGDATQRQVGEGGGSGSRMPERAAA